MEVLNEYVIFFFFFFKQKTAYEIVSRDWSSDVCSSDLKNYRGNSIKESIRCESVVIHDVLILILRLMLENAL